MIFISAYRSPVTVQKLFEEKGPITVDVVITHDLTPTVLHSPNSAVVGVDTEISFVGPDNQSSPPSFETPTPQMPYSCIF
ncbi:hypothetical protein TNCV_3403141 [Trichonephila clavipes]|nr:hypothetical protein TNCV_3403141 [Trichonephila clavipes]